MIFVFSFIGFSHSRYCIFAKNYYKKGKLSTLSYILGISNFYNIYNKFIYQIQ